MRLYPFAVLCLTFMPLVGCSSSDKDEHKIAQPTPPIFVEQVSVMLLNGQPQEVTAYQDNLRRCQADGTPIVPLSADAQARLGRRLIQTWEAPQQFSQRIQEWHQRLDGLCQFSLMHRDQVTIQTADHHRYTLDNTTGQGHAGMVNPSPDRPAQTYEDLELSSTAIDAGWVKPTRQPPLVGHTCLLWQSPTKAQMCVWDEGMAYGYSASAQGHMAGDGTPVPMGPIVMWQKPADGMGWEVRVTKLIVGEAIPESVFKLPPNAKL